MLCAIPALRALRGTAPRAHITLIGLPSARWAVERFHTYLNELLPFPGFPGIPYADFDARKTTRFFGECHERRFDLAIQLHGSGEAANTFARLIGARATAGAHRGDDPTADPDLFVEVTEEPEPARLLRVIEHLGASPGRGTELEFPISDEDEAELAEHDLEPGSYVCVQPGAKRPWQLENFVIVARALHDRGLRVVLTGADAERLIVEQLAEALDGDALDLAGELSLGATAALVRDAALLVANDGGLSQLAAATRTRSVIVCPADADIERWAPADRALHRPLGGAGQAVEPDAVLEQADDLLSEIRAAS